MGKRKSDPWEERTPGPWNIEWRVVSADEDDVADFGDEEKNINLGDELYRLPLKIGPISPNREIWEDNYIDISDGDAYLIAAAPDLLEALEMVRDADDDCERDGLPTIPGAARATIDAAIAKARGTNTSGN